MKVKDPAIAPAKGGTTGTRCLGPVADLEKHLPNDWWKSIFNSLYLKTDSDVVENEKNTVAEVDFLIEQTGVKPSAHILDLCCGQGRHAIELVKRGYRFVYGIDRSRFLIRLARKRAQELALNIRFSEGDARKIRLMSQSLDCIYLMGNSFGYFEKKEDDLAVLRECDRALQSQGKILLDIADGEWMREHLDRRSWEWIDQKLLVCRERTLSSDATKLISREVIIDAEKGVVTDQFYAERLYDYAELKDLLEEVGFVNVTRHQNVRAGSTRDQDLGMMANRLFVTAQASQKVDRFFLKPTQKKSLTVIMGDPRQPDRVKKGGKFNEEDLQTINTLKTTLDGIGKYQCTYLDNHKTLVKNLVQHPPTFVLNLCDEGFNNDAFKELHIPALLEVLDIPYTGAGPACLATCYDKGLVRSMAKELEIPVPEEIWIDPWNQSAALPSVLPALLKPAFGDSSIGITQHAVVHDAEQLMSYFDHMKQQLPGIPILVQEFLSGREFSVTVLGNTGSFETLPILEVDYTQLPAELPRLLCYESKWLPESPYWKLIRYHEASVDEAKYRQLLDNSFQLFERLGCRDYARFDFREDAQGQIKLLEVNPNPGWCWDGKFNLMAGMAGMTYGQLLDKVLTSALERYQINS